MRRQKGFTLIELIVVIAILAALLLILVPSLTGFSESAKHTAAQASIRNIQVVYEASELLVQTTTSLQRQTVSDPDGEFNSYQAVTIYGQDHQTSDPYSEAVRDRMKENLDFSDNHNFQLYASYDMQGNFTDLTVYYYDAQQNYYIYEEPGNQLRYCQRGSDDENCEVIRGHS